MARMTIQQLCRENQIYKLKVIQLTKERQMLECDYNARLKADMAAMLTEIQLEIEELDSRAGYAGNGMPTFSTDYIRKKKVNELIRRKINELKAESEG